MVRWTGARLWRRRAPFSAPPPSPSSSGPSKGQVMSICTPSRRPSTSGGWVSFWPLSCASRACRALPPVRGCPLLANPCDACVAPSAALGYVQAPLHGGPGEKGIQNALHVREVGEADDLTRLIEADQIAHPRENCDIGDGVRIAHHPGSSGQPALEHAQQAP